MIKTWSYFNPVKILVVDDFIAQLQTQVKQDDTLLLLTSNSFKERGITRQIALQLNVTNLFTDSNITTNPTLHDLIALTEKYINQRISLIIALGGGSVIDTAKVLSVTLTEENTKILNTVFRHNVKHQWKKEIPVIAIPTTSGTGAEVTPFATIWDNELHKKYSLNDRKLYPKIALLDANLTLTLPYQQTLYSGLDAVSHSLESLWNKNRTPISELYSLQALKMLAEYLPRIEKNADEIEVRRKIQEASLMAGIAISQTKTAAAHSISYPLTAHYAVPHGLACSFTLVNLIDVYLEQVTVSNEKREIFILAKNFLLTIDFSEHLKLFGVTQTEINRLENEMINPDRYGNFEITISDFINVLKLNFYHNLV